MNTLRKTITILLMAFSAARASDFADQVNLDEFRALTAQHRQTLKTLDSWARQTIYNVHGKYTLKNSGDPTIDGNDALFTALDIAFRPEKYFDRNILKIQNATLRQDFALLDSISSAEKDRILKQGTISLKFWMSPEVRALMEKQQSTAAFKMDAINRQHGAAMELTQLIMPGQLFLPLALIPPATAAAEDHKWRTLDDLQGNVPRLAEQLKHAGHSVPPALPNYDNARIDKIASLAAGLAEAWRNEDAARVNAAIAALAVELPQVNPAVYPSAAKRKVEVAYNSLGKLTWLGATFYGAAFVCFLMSARAAVSAFRLWGLRLFVVGLLIHAAGIAIRWWLVEKSVGNWFEAIPIKNQFESVLFSAFFGCVVGLIIALWRGGAVSSIIGAAASFVGALSLLAIFSAPYVFNREIGGEISQVQGVLMSYWLYIHVTMVVASYAMIGMSFLLGCMWLWYYLKEFGTVARVANKGQLAVDELRGFDVIMNTGGAATMSIGRTLACMFFLRRPVERTTAATTTARASDGTADFLRTIDACNVVVLQLAFWLLGVGIILGAVWADQSWGRPWGWDPKETFALVTWIVYLIIVHVRISVQNKGWWTAVLSILGFFIMLFNWVGVNFFMVGLHSYA